MAVHRKLVSGCWGGSVCDHTRLTVSEAAGVAIAEKRTPAQLHGVRWWRLYLCSGAVSGGSS